MLWNAVFAGWVANLTRWTINMFVWTDCKPPFFWHEFAAQYSSMLLAVMSIEKFFALYLPLKAKSYCTVGTAKWMTFILAIVLAGFNSPIFIYYEAIGEQCYVKHGDYFAMINTLFYALVPIFTMLLANAAIIYKLMYIKYKGISHTNESVMSSFRGTLTTIELALRGFAYTYLDPYVVQSPQTHLVSIYEV